MTTTTSGTTSAPRETTTVLSTMTVEDIPLSSTRLDASLDAPTTTEVQHHHHRQKPVSSPSQLKRSASVNYVPGEVIKRKREGRILSDPEINWMIRAYHDGILRDYQMSSFLMAIAVKGMNERECEVLTRAMISTGETVMLSDILRSKSGAKTVAPVVDKHSTGGVGDKTSLLVVPLAASLGFVVFEIGTRDDGD